MYIKGRFQNRSPLTNSMKFSLYNEFEYTCTIFLLYVFNICILFVFQ